ncbi:MAG: hypothetical protein ACXQTR_06440 [Candidatus Methanospirareceae archaeon]
MSNLYKLLILIITVILVMHFYPDYWVEILAAFPAGILIHFFFQHSREYESLRWLQIAKEKFHRYKRKRGLIKAIKKQENKEYLEKIIQNALDQAKSIDESNRKVGLEQLSQFGAEDDYVYEKLLEILKDGLSKSHEKQIVETLCKIFNDMKNMNTW